MSIQSASEFEAIINKLQMRMQKVLSERGATPAIEGAIRQLQRMHDAAREREKLKAMRKDISELTEVLGKEVPDDNAMLEQLWDLEDFVDYN